MSTNLIQFPGRIPQWSFADRARRVRRDVRMSQQEMADALGVGLKAYSAWETGRNTPTDIARVAVKLERITGVPRAWFLGWVDEGPRPDGPDGGVSLPHLDSNQEPIGSQYLGARISVLPSRDRDESEEAA